MITYLKSEYTRGDVLAEHVHNAGQILFSRLGVMEVTAGGRFFVIPSTRVAWIPAGTPHGIHFRTNTSLRTAYVDKKFGVVIPQETTVLQCSELFRPLMLRLVENAKLDRSYQVLLEQLLLRELAELRHESFSVTLPRDRRALRVAQAIVRAPAKRTSLENWSSTVGCSAKTLSRIFRNETHLPFRLWRRHVRLLASLPSLEEGIPISQTALATGFATPSAYTEAFRLTFGRTPTEHLALGERVREEPLCR